MTNELNKNTIYQSRIDFLNYQIAINIDKPDMVKSCLNQLEILYKKKLSTYQNNSFE